MKSPIEHGHLYFICSQQQDAVKVGYAQNINARLATLQTGNPHPLKVTIGVPVEFDAERAFHDFMRPHRIAREWYPDDILLDALAGALLEAWEDKVIDETPAADDVWPLTADYWNNEANVWLTADDVRRTLSEAVQEFFEPDPDDPTPLDITNHWIRQPAPKVRKLRPGYA